MALAIGKLQDAVYQNRPTNTDMNEATDKAIRPLSARVTALELQLAALCEVLDGRARAGVLPYAKSKAEAARELFRAGKTNAQRKGSARAAAVSPAHRSEARPGNKGNGPPQPSLEKKHPGHPCGNPLLPLPVGGRSAPRTWDRWCGRCRFGPGAPGQPLPLLGRRLRWCVAASAAVRPRGVLRTAVARRHPGTTGPGPRLRGVECRRATRAGTESGQLRHRHPTPPQMEREGEAASNAAAARAAVWRDRPARRGGVARRCRSVGTQKAATAATLLRRLLFVGRSPETRARRCRGRLPALASCAGEAGGTATAESARPVARQRPRHLPRRRMPRPPPFQQALPSREQPLHLPVRLPRAQAPSAFAFRRRSVRSRRTRSTKASWVTPRRAAMTP